MPKRITDIILRGICAVISAALGLMIAAIILDVVGLALRRFIAGLAPDWAPDWVLGAWFLAAGLAGLVIGWRLPARREPDPRLCSHCQYDLRATRGPTCPECGTPISPRQQTVIRQTDPQRDLQQLPHGRRR